MSVKYHINGNGDASECRATTEGGCPFGGDSGTENHFNTLAEARDHYEKAQSKNFITKISKNPKNTKEYFTQSPDYSSFEKISPEEVYSYRIENGKAIENNSFSPNENSYDLSTIEETIKTAENFLKDKLGRDLTLAEKAQSFEQAGYNNDPLMQKYKNDKYGLNTVVRDAGLLKNIEKIITDEYRGNMEVFLAPSSKDFETAEEAALIRLTNNQKLSKWEEVMGDKTKTKRNIDEYRQELLKDDANREEFDKDFKDILAQNVYKNHASNMFLAGKAHPLDKEFEKIWEAGGSSPISGPLYTKDYVEAELTRVESLKHGLKYGTVKPSKIVGGGYVNGRKVAEEYLDREVSKLKLALRTRGRNVNDVKYVQGFQSKSV